MGRGDLAVEGVVTQGDRVWQSTQHTCSACWVQVSMFRVEDFESGDLGQWLVSAERLIESDMSSPRV